MAIITMMTIKIFSRILNCVYTFLAFKLSVALTSYLLMTTCLTIFRIEIITQVAANIKSKVLVFFRMYENSDRCSIWCKDSNLIRTERKIKNIGLLTFLKVSIGIRYFGLLPNFFNQNTVRKYSAQIITKPVMAYIKFSFSILLNNF